MDIQHLKLLEFQDFTTDQRCFCWGNFSQIPSGGKQQYPSLELTYHLISANFKDVSSLEGTPWKISMEPENDGLEDDFPFQLGDF